MPTFEDPAADADEVQTVLRARARDRSIDDPRQIYSVLGSLTSAVASLSQSLHQLAHLPRFAEPEVDVGRQGLALRTRCVASGYVGTPSLRRDPAPGLPVDRSRAQRRGDAQLRPPRLSGACGRTAPLGRAWAVGL
jgi:hypothetical protein